jgi:type II secretory pathway pseudopilin PulG
MFKNGIKKNAGLTLIESLVVVGILLGIVAIALTLYGTVKDRLNVKNESENISFVYSQVIDLFSDETTDDLENDLAIESGIFPKKMKIVGDQVYNSWGGTVVVKGDNGGNGFMLTYNKVPKGGVCGDLIRNQRKVGWDSASLGSDKIDYADMTASKLAAGCNAGSGETVNIIFEYGIDSE